MNIWGGPLSWKGERHLSEGVDGGGGPRGDNKYLTGFVWVLEKNFQVAEKGETQTLG
jgi:hypothetical protein